MEYNGPEEEKEEVDIEKVNYINNLGRFWMPQNCESSSIPDKCSKIQGILKEYGSDYFKIRKKIDECGQIFEQESEYSNTAKAYENCMETAIRSFSWMIDSFYDELKKTES